MRILGVDPGSRRCGYGVVEAPAGSGVRLVYVECGVIEMAARAPLAERLADLSSSLAEVIAELSPDVVAVEDVFYGIDARAALILGHARGVVLAQAGAAKLLVHAYPPATVKKSVTGRGAAPKEQVGGVVKALLHLTRPPLVDAADALAVAICHAYHARVPAKLAAAKLSAAHQVRRRAAK